MAIVIGYGLEVEVGMSEKRLHQKYRVTLEQVAQTGYPISILGSFQNVSRQRHDRPDGSGLVSSRKLN